MTDTTLQPVTRDEMKLTETLDVLVKHEVLVRIGPPEWSHYHIPGGEICAKRYPDYPGDNVTTIANLNHACMIWIDKRGWEFAWYSGRAIIANDLLGYFNGEPPVADALSIPAALAMALENETT